jgi:hypothetical protein
MAKFRASKGYHFSKDGTEATTWAKFEHVPKSEPPAYEFDTTVKSEIDAVRKIIDNEVEGYTDIVEVVEKTARGGRAGKAGANKAGKAGDDDSGQGDGGDGGTQGAGGSGGQDAGNGGDANTD